MNEKISQFMEKRKVQAVFVLLIVLLFISILAPSELIHSLVVVSVGAVLFLFTMENWGALLLKRLSDGSVTEGVQNEQDRHDGGSTEG